MRSFVIVEVEHGETTDPLDAFAAYVSDPIPDFRGMTILNYSVRVDLPPYITCESLSTHGLPKENPYE
jgi:hypothetical protein